MKRIGDSIEYPSASDLAIWYWALQDSETLDREVLSLPHVGKGWYESMASAFQIVALHPDCKNDLYKAAALLFYKICKNHYLPDGNKRSTVICFLFFLAINGYWTDIAPNSLYELAKRVAESERDRERDVLVSLEQVFKKALKTVDRLDLGK